MSEDERSGPTAEDGVSAVLMALLLVPLLGMAALVIDVALMYHEVRQLQNGADAAALAIAQDCAEDNCGSDVSRDALARHLADSNSRDGSSAAQVQYPGLDGPNSVTVTTTTRDADDAPRLAYLFAPVLGFEEGAFERSATAVWGPLGAPTGSIPVTFSICEWDGFTGGLGADGLPTGSETIVLKTNPGANECAYGGPGFDAPGGFGWLDLDGSGECIAAVDESGFVDGNTGNSPPNSPVPGPTPCTPEFFANLIGETIPVPIFVDAQPPTGNVVYELVGFAGFKLSGYKLGSVQYTTSPNPCLAYGTGSSSRCLEGQFVEYSTLDGEIDPTAPDLGARAVQLSR